MVLVLITRVKAEHVCSEVDGHAVVCGVTHPSQMWSMPHKILINSGISYPYLGHPPCATIPLMNYMAQEALDSNIQGNS